MKVISFNANIDMLIISLDVGEHLPDKVMIICNDYSKTYDMRDNKK